MNCDEAQTLIGAYAGEELGEEARRAVERHLFSCEACAAQAMTLTITRARLRENAGDVAASDAFRARALRRLQSENEHLTNAETPEDAAQYRLPIEI